MKSYWEKSMFNPLKTSLVVIGLSLGATLTGCAATSTHESTGGYVDNSVITTKVKTAILDDASLKVFEIHVVTYKDVVQLSGFVDSQQMVSRAGVVAAKVEGVKSVKNDLVVK
jgi:osmotically-inducible protein OsmY